MSMLSALRQRPAGCTSTNIGLCSKRPCLARQPQLAGWGRGAFGTRLQDQRPCTRLHASYYDLLGVPATASVDDIKSAFRVRAKELHPDVNPAANADERFRAVKHAYDVLSDNVSRRDYDKLLDRKRSNSRAGPSRSAPGGAGGAYGGAGLDWGTPGAGSRYARTSSGRWAKSPSAWVSFEEAEDADEDWFVRVEMEDSDGEDHDPWDDAYFSDYTAWASSANNVRSSYQSSWEANRNKRRRAAQAKAAADAAAKAKAQAGGRGGSSSSSGSSSSGSSAGARQAQRGGGGGGGGGGGAGSAGGARNLKGQQYYQQGGELTPLDKELLLQELQVPYRRIALQVFGPRLQNLESIEELIDVCETLESLEASGIQMDVAANVMFQHSRRSR